MLYVPKIEPHLRKRTLFLIIVLHCFSLARAQDLGVVMEEPDAKPLDEFKVALKLRPLNFLIYPLSLGSWINANAEAEFPIDMSKSFSAGIQFLDYSGSSFIGAGTGGTVGNTVSLRLDFKIYPLAKKRSEFCEGLFLGPYAKIRSEAIQQSVLGPYTSFAVMPGFMAGYQLVHGQFVASYLIGGGAGLGVTSGLGALFLDFRTGISIGFTI